MASTFIQKNLKPDIKNEYRSTKIFYRECLNRTRCGATNGCQMYRPPKVDPNKNVVIQHKCVACGCSRVVHRHELIHVKANKSIVPRPETRFPIPNSIKSGEGSARCVVENPPQDLRSPRPSSHSQSAWKNIVFQPKPLYSGQSLNNLPNSMLPFKKRKLIIDTDTKHPDKKRDAKRYLNQIEMVKKKKLHFQKKYKK